MKELIKQIIKRFHELNLPKIVKRDITLPINKGKIISVIGARRSGKTYLLFDTIKRLLNSGIPRQNILYLNFEDERLQLKASELDLILQAWRELHNGQDISSHYFFFDEIQNIPGWEKFVRRIYDFETKNIFLTGSNSEFLIKEVTSAMRGRSLPLEVFPFNFSEYLRMQNIDTDLYSVQNKAKIINKFYEYLFAGGFPETIGLEEYERQQILQTYFYVMLYKDLIERYKINATIVVKNFIKKLADNLSKPFSLNRIYNVLHSWGMRFNKNLLYDLIEYVENSYIAFSIERFSFSLLSRSKSLKKIYFIDNGLANTINFSTNTNKGQLLENLVFLYLRTHFGNIYEKNIFYFKNNYECDFVVFKFNKPALCTQVSFDISDEQTLRRELKGLLECLKHFNLNTGYIITAEQENQLSVDNKKVLILPAYKVLLQNKNIWLNSI